MEEQKKKSLSEISHLFLSSVRDNATGGMRPRRIPPGADRPISGATGTRLGIPPTSRTAMSIDLTPDEYARAVSAEENDNAAEPPPYGPVAAIICSQFNSQQFERAKEYARHLASAGERIGLIQVDASECTVTCFETGEPTPPMESVKAAGPRQVAEALDELAWDVDRWLLLLPSPRLPEARALLRRVDHWVLLSTCDHDGVVSCYRAIKGLAEIPRPRLTLALMNAADQAEAGKVYRKIAGVCEQFLNWKMEAESAVEPTDTVAENVTLSYCPDRDRAEAGAGPQWELVLEFLARAQSENNRTGAEPARPISRSLAVDEVESASPEVESFEVEPLRPVGKPVTPPAAIPAPIVESKPDPAPVVKMVEAASPTIQLEQARVSGGIEDDGEVAELADGVVTEAAVLSAIFGKSTSGLVRCQISPPGCPQAALAVGRDRRLVLLAVARKGLAELRAIATAYRWVIENRPLLAMALPQLAIDTHAHPSLTLLVDRADAGADLLLPMAEQGSVTVQTYRKLRWAGKTGLLLEAA